MQHTEHKGAGTGYSVLRVTTETRTRIAQLRQQLGISTDDELLTLLLDEHDQRKSSTSHQLPD